MGPDTDFKAEFYVAAVLGAISFSAIVLILIR